MTHFEMLRELYEMTISGEIDSCEDVPAECDEFEPVKFIQNLYTHVSENEDQFVEETTERQRATIRQLFEGYVNDNWQPLENYLSDDSD